MKTKTKTIDQCKSVVENFCYRLGLKVNLGREQIKELMPTTSLKQQFDNLSTIKKWLEEDLLQFSTQSGRSAKEPIQPELKKIIISTSPLKEHFALIWSNSSKTVTVGYDQNGSIFFLEKEITKEGEKTLGYGSGLNSVRMILLNLNNF
jgi:hypothetical protein